CRTCGKSASSDVEADPSCDRRALSTKRLPSPRDPRAKPPSKPDAQADDRPAHLHVPHETAIAVVDAEVPIADSRLDTVAEPVVKRSKDLPGQVRRAAADIGICGRRETGAEVDLPAQADDRVGPGFAHAGLALRQEAGLERDVGVHGPEAAAR